MEVKVKQELERCDNLGQMLNVLQSNYDLTAKIGVGSKAVIIAQVPTLLQISLARKK